MEIRQTFLRNLCDGSPNSNKCSTVENALIHACDSLKPNVVRWKLGCRRPVDLKERWEARKFRRDRIFEQFILPFISFATNTACWIFLRRSSVSRPIKRHRSGYGGSSKGFCQGRCLSAIRTNLFCTRSTLKHQTSWYGFQTRQAFSSSGRTSEQYNAFKQYGSLKSRPILAMKPSCRDALEINFE